MFHQASGNKLKYCGEVGPPQAVKPEHSAVVEGNEELFHFILEEFCSRAAEEKEKENVF